MTYGGIAEKAFTIDPVTGVITTTKPLDRELHDFYTVTGTVRLLVDVRCLILRGAM